MRNFERLACTLRDIFREPVPEPREVRQILAIKKILEGEAGRSVSAEFRLQRGAIEDLARAVRAQGLEGFGPFKSLTAPELLGRRQLGIAQMLLGALAERRFEEISAQITGTGILRIEDHRPSRTDTDYRLLNSREEPICRLNIKFHGTLFRGANRFVGLEPEDCFPLATYKIKNGLKRQNEERLPYVFLVLSVPDLNAGDVATSVPDDYVWALAILQGKRKVEEAIVDRLRGPDFRESFRKIFDRMPEGKFRIISASKAYNLLRDKLFERVHALSFPAFARNFRNAEVDMHFSLANDLTPVRTFLELIKESPQRVAVTLDRGEI